LYSFLRSTSVEVNTTAIIMIPMIMAKPTRRKTSGTTVVVSVLSFALVGVMFVYLVLIHKIVSSHDNTNIVAFGSPVTSSDSLKEETRQLRERIQNLESSNSYLETKMNSYLAFKKDPFLSNKKPATCIKSINVVKIACQGIAASACGVDNLDVCLDDLPYQIGEDSKGKKDNCVVYDFGIRTNPEYGLAFAKQCDVVGFDPSPISIEWWKEKQTEIQAKYPNYKFSPKGAGGWDGIVELGEYDWGQVSIIQFPEHVINTTNCNKDGACKYHFYNQQKQFKIPVQTLQSAMQEHGHSHISLLKIDVEGSEYAFLEAMIDDLSCRRVDQLALEWHHYDYDTRYGVTSNPQINVLVALLKERCGLEQFSKYPGWPSNNKIYADMGMTLYYSLSSFKRTKHYN